jgi:methionyl-tRNA synthetase
VLYVAAEVLRQVSILAQPFVPTAAGALLDLLAVPAAERDFEHLAFRIKPGSKLPAPAAIFPRYVEPDGAAAS